jgi:hypothetical protein
MSESEVIHEDATSEAVEEVLQPPPKKMITMHLNPAQIIRELEEQEQCISKKTRDLQDRHLVDMVDTETSLVSDSMSLTMVPGTVVRKDNQLVVTQEGEMDLVEDSQLVDRAMVDTETSLLTMVPGTVVMKYNQLVETQEGDRDLVEDMDLVEDSDLLDSQQVDRGIVDMVVEDMEVEDMKLPLPPSYQFLEEVFQAMDLFVPIMHHRKQRLSVTRLISLVQQKIKKKVLKSDLQKILHLIPSASQYTWEKCEVKGKFVLEISPYNVERLSPREIMERRTKFHLKLVNILKTNPSSEMIHECDFPAEPVVEPVQSAAQVLQNSRHLFEITPKFDTSKPAPKPIHKKLQGLPPKLVNKIVAKEADKAAREMFSNKGREEKIKRLRRLPVLARILKNTFTSENKASLPFEMVVKKAVSSHPGHFPSETIVKDLRYLIEVSQPWVTNPKVQGTEYLKLNKNIDVNQVVEDVEMLLEDEDGGEQARMSGDSYFAAQAEKVVTSDHTMGGLKSPMELEVKQLLRNFNLPYETEVSRL